MTMKLFFALALAFQLHAGDIGVVNFKTILEDSKVGKEQQNGLEAMRKQMASTMEKLESELGEMQMKAQDPDFIDSLSPEAEEEFRMKAGRLSSEYQQNQQQFYQIMNQAEYKLVAEVSSHISSASQGVAKEKNLDLVLRDDVCFYFQNDMDVTNAVLKEMDQRFDRESKG
jgi:outer membrane protein